MYRLHPFDDFKGKKLTLQSAVGTPIEVDGTNPQAVTVTWQSVQGQNAQGTLQGEPILANNADIYPINEVMFRHR